MIRPVLTEKESPIVCNSGIRTPHKVDDVMDFELGSYYVIMLFHTPFIAKTESGREKGNPGQMLINTPSSHHWHRGLPGESFCNDWVHLSESAVKDTIEDCGLPLNRIFSVSNDKFLERIISEVSREQLLNAPSQHAMIACKITELLLLISRYYQLAQRMAASPVEYTHYEQLCVLRQNLQQSFADTWTVDAMARKVHLSPNRFAVLYKKFFNISPMDDLIEMRLTHAKWLLAQGFLTVGEVADRCGFRSLSYFSRLFKSRTGQTPKRFKI